MTALRSFCVSAPLLAFTIFYTTSVAASVIFPTGLRIGLEPPAEAKLSARFSGFEDTARKVTITVLDLPGDAYSKLETSLFNKNQRGIEDYKHESFALEGGSGILASGRVQLKEHAVYRRILLAKPSSDTVKNLTALITVDVPETAHAIYTDALVRKILATVAFRPTPIQEQLSFLPFTFGELAGFQVAQVLPEGRVILADDPKGNLETQSYMIVALGRGEPNQTDRSRFARDLVVSMPLPDLSLQSSEAMRVLGLPGHEIRATAKGPGGVDISLVQWVRFSGGGFMRIVGVSRKDAWDNSFPRFRRVRDAIEFK